MVGVPVVPVDVPTRTAARGSVKRYWPKGGWSFSESRRSCFIVSGTWRRSSTVFTSSGAPIPAATSLSLKSGTGVSNTLRMSVARRSF